MGPNVFILAAVAATIASATFAAGPSNLGQLDQERLIDTGERSGKLTHAEASKLNADQRSIQRLESRMRAGHGGHLNALDSCIHHARQIQTQGNMRQEKHDCERGRKRLDV